MKKLLFLVSSSYGHLCPAIKLAHKLQASGHETLFVTADETCMLLSLNGLPSIPVKNTPNPFFATADWYVEQTIFDQYQVLKNIVEQFKPDELYTTPLIMPAFILAQQYQIFLNVIGYTEYLYPDLVLGERSSKLWRLNVLMDFYNKARAKLGFDTVATDIQNPALIGDRYLMRSTAEFDERQVLPQQVSYIGGLYYDPPYHNPKVLDFIRRSKSEGNPVWYVQIGRLFEHFDKWENLIKCLGKLDMYFLVDVHRADYLTNNYHITDNIQIESFVPLGFIQNELNGIISSGQTSSVLAAIKYNKPLLCFPSSDDAKELSARVTRHKLGLMLTDWTDLTAEQLYDYLTTLASADRMTQQWTAAFKCAEDNFLTSLE